LESNGKYLKIREGKSLNLMVEQKKKDLGYLLKRTHP
jgi:hypothetical protein